MEPGDHLVDSEGSSTPYRIEDLVATGENHQVVEAYDTDGEQPVAVRALLYDGEFSEPEIAGLRSGLRRQWRFLEDVADSDVAPKPVAWLEVGDSPVDRPPEPLIVCELVDGTPLDDWLDEHHPEGMEPATALEFIADFVDFLETLHAGGWLWRDFDPGRLAVDEEGRLRAVSVAGVIRRTGEDPPAPGANPAYVAPELRTEARESHRTPSADLYGLGSLLSYVLTGEPTRHRVESPLSYPAHERIRDYGAAGLELLIARLLQPMSKKRLQSASQLRGYLDIEQLPTQQDSGFDDCQFPAPWEGLDIEDPEKNRGLRSSLSSGPLVSMSRDSNVQEEPKDDAGTGQRVVNWPLVFGLIAVVVAVVVIGVVFIG